MATVTLLLVIFLIVFDRGLAWSQDELDIFDLVEEIEENFYDLLKVEKDCSSAEIRKAYRKLSLVYHPDKNPDPNAAEIFTKIGAVAEVLRDEEKRAMYDAVLEHGLPDWKQPVYYYRRVRKMGWAEFIALFAVVMTIGQFLFGWAAYLEKQIVLYELKTKRDEKVRKSKGKKTHQQLETELMYYELLTQSYKPSWSKLLPFMVLKAIYRSLAMVVGSVYALLVSYKDKQSSEKMKQEQIERERLEKQRREREEEEERERLKQEEEKARVKSEKKLRKLEQTLKATRLKNEQKELEERLAMEESRRGMEAKLREIEDQYQEEGEERVGGKGGGRKKAKKGQKITDLSDTFVPLVDSISPSDSPDYANGYTDPLLIDVGGVSSVADDDDGSGWSQYQQKQLEWALSHYTRETGDRWDKVAKAVPGKSKIDCVDRYKQLVLMIKSKKIVTDND